MGTRRIKIFTFVFAIFFVFLLRNSVFSLPTKEPGNAHGDLTKMSSEIKYNLQESGQNGLRNAINQTFGNLDNFRNSLSSSNVSEDYWRNSTTGGQHYFDPTTGKGMWGIFPSAKSRASDLYNSAMKVRCFSVPLGIANATRPWEIFAHTMHLMQDMTTPAHTIIQDHADGDSFEKYVEKNWQ